MEVIVRIRMAQVNVFLGGSAIQATTRMRRVLSRPGCIALHCTDHLSGGAATTWISSGPWEALAERRLLGRDALAGRAGRGSM